jgi:PAS domain S-box-containing protein
MNITQEELEYIKKVNAGDFAVYLIESGIARVIYYSPSIPAFSGLTDEEYKKVFGDDSYAGIVESDVPIARAALEKTIAGGDDADFTFRIFHAKRGFSWTHAKIKLLRKEGNSALVVADFQNTSEETDTYANLLNQAKRIIYVIDAATCELYYMNRTAMDFWHLDKMKGGPCHLQLRGQEQICPWCVLPGMKGGSLHKGVHYDPNLDLYLQIDAQKLRWYGRDCYAVFTTDVTESYRNEKEIENANSEMTRVINGIPAGICVFGKSGGEIVCIDANPYCCELIGRKKEDLLGVTFGQIVKRVHPDDEGAFRREFGIQLKQTRRASGAYRFIKSRENRYVWMRLEARLVKQPNGEDYCYMNIADVDALKRAESNAEANRRIYETAANAGGLTVWEYDIRRHRIVFMDDGSSNTQQWEGTWKLPKTVENVPDSIVGDISSEDVQAFLDLYKKVDECGSASAEIWVRLRSSGQLRCYRIVYAPTDGTEERVTKAYGIARDITAEKQEVEKYRRTLQDLLTVNPQALCTFRLNLTQNTSSEGHGSSTYIQDMLSADTTDALFANIMRIITVPSDAEEFHRKLSREALLAEFKNGAAHEAVSYRRLIENGGSHWVTTYVNMLKNPDTEDVEAIVYSVDVDREKKEEQIIRSITSNEYDYVALVDTDTHDISFLNFTEDKGALPVQRQSYDESIRETFRAFAEPDDAERYKTDMSFPIVAAKLDQDEVYTISYLLHDEQHRKYRKQMSFRYLDETKSQILITRSDVTAAFLQEQRQAQRIQDALDSAKKANSLKSEFLSNVSHDMRTPLNAILGYTRLALSSDDPQATRDYLTKTERAGNTLLSLINDTLDLQKIETGAIRLKPEPISCGDIIRGITTAVRPMIDKKQIAFTLDNSRAVMATINADAMRVQEIFINLLSNAVKFTPEGGHIELIVECVKLEKNCVHDRLIVRDNGIGISSGFLPKIFEPFAQERTAETAQIGGSGLGLSIVKRLVEMMGGRLEVESELGRGTQFTVYLDFERIDELDQEADKPGGSQVRRLDGKKVLLCEDNAMNTE